MNLDQLTYKINGCAMKVHNTLGNGFQEVIYQRCLAIELGDAGIHFLREEPQTIYYEGINVGTRRADFIIEDTVIVELKAVINLEDVHLAQAKNYVVAYNKPIGLLINFGSTSLQFKKVFNPKYNPDIKTTHHTTILKQHHNTSSNTFNNINNIKSVNPQNNHTDNNIIKSNNQNGNATINPNIIKSNNQNLNTPINPIIKKSVNPQNPDADK